jgi:hypothetical protein
MKKSILLLMLMTVAAVVLAEGKPQTICPVMGAKINPKQYVDAEGYRIYICCRGCAGAIQADPGKYIQKMKAEGVEPERIAQ